MNVEEADWLDKDELKSLTKDKEVAIANHKSMKEFTKKLSDARKAAGRAAGDAGNARRRGRGRGRAGPAAAAEAADDHLSGRSYKPLPAGDLPQSVLKVFAPPGGYVWEGRATGTWHGHFKPFPRVSRSWLLHGHRGAALL
eukprot:10607040-Lingulodinium_polyedra.AAC.1